MQMNPGLRVSDACAGHLGSKPLSLSVSLSLSYTHTHTHTHTKEHLTEFLPTSKGPGDKREGPCPSGAPHQETRALMGAIWLQKSIPQSLLPPSPQPSLVSPHGELIAEFLKTCTAFMPQLVGSKGSFFFFFFFNVRNFQLLKPTSICFESNAWDWGEGDLWRGCWHP